MKPMSVRQSQRTCIGCLQKKPKAELIRLTLKNHQVVANSDSRSQGRGVYFCRNARQISPGCLKLAQKKKDGKIAFN